MMKFCCHILLTILCITEGWGYFYGSNLRFKNKLRRVKLPEINIQNWWYNQTLDHFDDSDNRIWQQRYLVNETFTSKERNVAFLDINGEAYMLEDNGFFRELAEKYHAITFELEHRFYGRSHPLDDLNLENLQYLTTEQALADIAAFITAMNDQYKLSPDVKWIVFGGSYAGSLAAWARLKYPKLIQGAVSASGPLLAKLNFDEFLGKVYEDIDIFGLQCTKNIQNAYIQLGEMLKNPEKHDELNKIFNLCDPIQDSIKNNASIDIDNLYGIITEAFASAAQNGFNNDGTNPALLIDCLSLLNPLLGDEVHRLAFIAKYSVYGCLNYKNDNQIEKLKKTKINELDEIGYRQWTYQTCTAFGYFQTTDHKPQIFGNTGTLDSYLRICTDVFGDKYNKKFVVDAIEKTNSLYGGLDINVTNVAFVHGSKDPWRELGPKKVLNPASPVIVIEGVAHCAILEGSQTNDLPQLRAARVQVSDLIGTWLGQK